MGVSEAGFAEEVEKLVRVLFAKVVFIGVVSVVLGQRGHSCRLDIVEQLHKPFVVFVDPF
jgi:hypothetical protein